MICVAWKAAMETSPVLAFKVFVSAALIAGLIDMYLMLVIKFFREDYDGLRDSSEESFTGRTLVWASRRRLFRILIGDQTIAFLKTRTILFPFFELTFSVVVLTSLYIHGVDGDFVRSVLYTLIAVPIAIIDWESHLVYTITTVIGVAIGVATTLLPGSISIIDSLLGLLVSGFMFAIFFVLARMLFPGVATPMGLGDVYVAIMIGAFSGLSRLMPSLFVGMLLAGVYSAILIYKRRRGRYAPEFIAYPSFLLVGAIYGMLIEPP
jgi:prepilin signal peptidase PulO-like enzyme (type II secretory pathway)